MSQGTIVKVSGPLVVAAGMENADMFDVVRVGDLGLIGEIIEMRGDRVLFRCMRKPQGLDRGLR